MVLRCLVMIKYMHEALTKLRPSIAIAAACAAACAAAVADIDAYACVHEPHDHELKAIAVRGSNYKRPNLNQSRGSDKRYVPRPRPAAAKHAQKGKNGNTMATPSY